MSFDWLWGGLLGFALSCILVVVKWLIFERGRVVFHKISCNCNFRKTSIFDGTHFLCLYKDSDDGQLNFSFSLYNSSSNQKIIFSALIGFYDKGKMVDQEYIISHGHILEITNLSQKTGIMIDGNCPFYKGECDSIYFVYQNEKHKTILRKLADVKPLIDDYEKELQRKISEKKASEIK